MHIHPSESARFILDRTPGFKAKIGLILGSGLSGLAAEIREAKVFSYSEIPGFPKSTVVGHPGKLILGNLAGMPIACMQGRIHPYEGVPYDSFKTIIRTFKLIGCEILILTNAAGSLQENFEPGSLMLINDHINLHYGNPLIGPNDEEFGSRFFPMDNAYDENLRIRFQQIAKNLQIHLNEGVYLGTPGPNFETPAEIRAYKQLGGDAIGMSTVPEVLVARHCGLRVAAVAAITNYGAGMSAEKITHEHTLHYSHLVSADMGQLICGVVGSLKQEPC
ncbi:MAG: purine-nucleoside phosphorylase [Oligoflexus sp.]